MRIATKNRARLAGAAVLAFALLLLPSIASAQLLGDPMNPTQNLGIHPDLLKQVRIDQKLDDSIPLNLTFRDEHDKTVELAQYFGSKPVILTLVYYSCPMLCTQVLNGLDRSMENIPLTIGKDFNVVTVSIDPTERPVLAEAKQELYTGMYRRPGAAQGWHFLTGDEPQIKALADAVGFHYAYDPDSKQYAHAAAIMLLTPNGRISRYFYGVTYPERDLRLGLVDASSGRIGSHLDAAMLYCYHYDPHTGKYGLLISHVIQVSGALTILIGGIGLFILFRGEHYVPWNKT
ncbi:MAG TPA: SCO family protein [Candidatus Acidoferrales bacterium]|jgi:protein SCO1/2|nr:SCO family protein [Candidatus Acidoferrales bacterium]